MNRSDLTEDQNDALSRRLGALLRFVSVGCGVKMVRKSELLTAAWSCGDPDLTHCARCRPIINEILSLQEIAERSELRAAVAVAIAGEQIEVGSKYIVTDFDEDGDTPPEIVKVLSIKTKTKIRFKKLASGSTHIYDESFFRARGERIDE